MKAAGDKVGKTVAKAVSMFGEEVQLLHTLLTMCMGQLWELRRFEDGNVQNLH